MVCERLHGDAPVAIYSSDFARALETVQPLAEVLRLEVIPMPAFRAFDQGEFMGKTLEETRLMLGEDVWNEIVTNPDPHKRYFAGGETLYEEQERAWCGLAELVRKHSPDDCMVISTHLTIRDAPVPDG